MTAQAFHTGQCRTHQHPLRAHGVYRAAVTAARLLDGARSVLGYQTRYAAVGYHHAPQVIQPTRWPQYAPRTSVIQIVSNSTCPEP